MSKSCSDMMQIWQMKPRAAQIRANT